MIIRVCKNPYRTLPKCDTDSTQKKKSDHILRSRSQFSFFMSNFLHVSWTMTLNWRLTHPNILFLFTFLQTRVGDRSNFHVSDYSLQKPAEFGAYHQHLHSVIVSYWNKPCHPIWIGLILTQKIKTPIPEISSTENVNFDTVHYILTLCTTFRLIEF